MVKIKSRLFASILVLFSGSVFAEDIDCERAVGFRRITNRIQYQERLRSVDLELDTEI